MPRLLIFILALTTTYSWGTQVNLDQHGKVSTKSVTEYKSKQILFENQDAINQAQVKSIIFPSDHTDFINSPDLTESQITAKLSKVKIGSDSPTILKQTTTMAYLTNGQSKEHTQLIVQLTRKNQNPNLLSYDPLSADLEIKQVQLYTSNKKSKTLPVTSIKTIRFASSGKHVFVYPKVEFNDGVSLLYVSYELTSGLTKPLIDSTFKPVAKETDLTLMVPNTHTLNFNNSFGKPTIGSMHNPIKNNQIKTYKWSITLASKQPQILYYTSYTKWTPLIRKYQKLMQNNQIIESDLLELVSTITTEESTELEKLESIYNWIQTNIMLDTSSPTQAPEKTLKRKVGSYQSRILLLSELLNRLSIPNELVLVIPKALPIVSDHFQNLICKVKVKEITYYLDLKTNHSRFPTLSPKLEETLFLNLTTKKIGKLRDKTTQFKSKTEIALKLKLDKNQQVTTNINISMQGQIESSIRKELHNSHSTFSKLFSRKLKVDPERIQNETAVDAYDFSKPLAYHATYSRVKQWLKLGDKMLVFMPELENLIDRTPTDYTFDILVNIPAGYKFNPPKELNIDNDKKQIFNKTFMISNNSVIIKISFSTIAIADSQKSTILNELKKPILFERLEKTKKELEPK